MSLMSKIRQLLDLIEGHEDTVAREVSKRTSLSETQAKEGLVQIQEAVNTETNDGTEDRSHR